MSEAKQITQEDMLKLIKEMSEANREFAQTVAQTIANPPPSEEKIAFRKRTNQEKADQARIEEADRANRKKFCVHPASPQMPHRRSGTQWGIFNGTSVIAWGYQQYAQKGPDGRTYLTPEMPVGVCQWCHSDFRPGDPDYEEAISWGLSQTSGSYAMNRHSGNWES